MTAIHPSLRTPALPERPAWLPEAVWPFPLHSLTVDGRRVVYTDTGGDGPVLLFVHVGMWSLMWGGLIGELAGRYRCITLDAPGAGLSDAVPRGEQNLTTAATAIRAVVDHLDLRKVTLVMHDLGGLATLAAFCGRTDRVVGLAAVNTFAWRPHGVLLPAALRLFGSAPMRGFGALTGLLPKASSTRFGVGRHMPRATRRAWRGGLAARDRRRSIHRAFHDAARNRRIHDDAEATLAALTDRPLITVFGRFGDYFGFQRQWRTRHPGARRIVVPGGFHFPTCDNPRLVADALEDWHRTEVRAVHAGSKVPSGPLALSTGDGRADTRGHVGRRRPRAAR